MSARVHDRAPALTHLGKMAFFIDQRQQGAGFPSQELQDVFIVTEFDIVPLHALFQILLLLQLEHVADEELLQLLVGKVNAQLLEAAQGRKGRSSVFGHFTAADMMCEEEIKKS